MNFKSSNIKKSPLTTAVGLLVIIGSIVSVFFPSLGIDWSGAGVGIAVGSTFLFASDGNKQGGGGKAAMLAILIFGLNSCVTYEKCQDKFGNGTDTVTIEKTVEVVRHDTIIKPIDSISTIIKFRDKGKIITDTVEIENPVTGMQLRYWRDEANRLRVQCNTKADTVVINDTIYKEVKVDCPPVNYFKAPEEPKCNKWFGNGVITGIIGTLFLLLILTIAFKKLF